ncbi:MAG: hemerythrin domain-containing protein [Gammaproteobacteria bacterium]
MQVAISIIRDEHRSIAAVLHGLLYLVGEIKANNMQPDFALLGAMLHYIEAFPEKLHHPKEDDYLYRALRKRDADSADILDVLEAEHVAGRQLIIDLKARLAEYQQTGAEAFEAFDQAVEQFADFHWAHMRKEEDIILPRAEAALTEDDWQAINTAFQSNQDPIVGIDTRQEFRKLFSRIASLAPAPIGLGPPASPKNR